MFGHVRTIALLLTAIAVTAGAQPGQSSTVNSAEYANPSICAGCHRTIWETYRKTGMGQSFYRPPSIEIVEDFERRNTFYHAPSRSYFRTERRGEEIFQSRYQLDDTGREINALEKRVDFVMGSGRHARTYLHRTPRGTLIELPLGWYSEKGGYWGMNPGYDRADHQDFRRQIGYDCMFCHNAYPRIPSGHDRPLSEPVYRGELPEGIDCQRCHGPGLRHAQLAGSGNASKDSIRGSVVNPSRLNAERQLEVCMACHLESTSFPLPNAIERYGRGPFSYQPGEPLSSFLLNFDHPVSARRGDKFELVSAAYRLRRSACFLKSQGKLVCTTCHNPHDIPRGTQAQASYGAACRQCHNTRLDQAIAAGAHPKESDCAGCHMPKRRTEDVVHASVTDHFIHRRPVSGELLAERPERHESGSDVYQGPVALYYPDRLPRTPENELDLAVAQVIQRSNLSQGIGQLAAAIQRYRPARAEYYFVLAQAWRDAGDYGKAVPLYRQAMERDRGFAPAKQQLGFALRRTAKPADAVAVLQDKALDDNPAVALELGLALRSLDRPIEALNAFERAARLDPDMPEAQNNLGIAYLSQGNASHAEAAFREAIRLTPNYVDANANLASLLSGTGQLLDALAHFRVALALRPRDAALRYNYAVALGRSHKFDEARRNLEECLRLDSAFADAHQLLGDMLLAENAAAEALPHYRESARLRPESAQAHLSLGEALIAVGNRGDAARELKSAAAGQDRLIRDSANRLLQSLKQ